MKRYFLCSWLLPFILSACTPATPTPIIPTRVPPIPEILRPPTIRPELTPNLKRGINFGDALESPNEGEWGLTVQEEYFDLIQGAGFDFVRLPVRWNAHAEETEPYTIEPEFFKRIDKVVGWALARNITIIIDLHHYEELVSDPWGNEARFLGLWRQIAEHYRDYPPQVLFELLNEPGDPLDASLWNRTLAEALSIVRETNPSRDVVIGPDQWNAYDRITTLDVPQDEHLIATFHYYLPFEFTHQGADWVGEDSNAWLGTSWDGTDEQKNEIASNFDFVSEWAVRKHVRILLGEFGAYSRADMASRARWTTVVRSEAERHGFAWSYWEFGSGFGAYDLQAGAWRGELLMALIPY